VVELEPRHLFYAFCVSAGDGVVGRLPGGTAEAVKSGSRTHRFASELHDGALQSMLAVAMQLDVLRRHSASQPVTLHRAGPNPRPPAGGSTQAARVDATDETPLEVEAKNLRAHLMELVDRFERETGITARLSANPL